MGATALRSWKKLSSNAAAKVAATAAVFFCGGGTIEKATAAEVEAVEAASVVMEATWRRKLQRRMQWKLLQRKT